MHRPAARCRLSGRGSALWSGRCRPPTTRWLPPPGFHVERLEYLEPQEKLVVVIKKDFMAEDGGPATEPPTIVLTIQPLNLAIVYKPAVGNATTESQAETTQSTSEA